MRVDHVLFDKGRAIGLRALKAGTIVEQRAVRELILSAGTLISSGNPPAFSIGPAALLSKLGIATVHDSLGVGQPMQEPD